MARKRKTRRRKRSGGIGRLFEGMVALILLLVVLTFGISIASRFLPEDEEPTMVVQQHDVRGPAVRAPIPAARLIQEAQIEVRNGCGRNGLARSMGLELREAGFDVLEWADLKPYDHEVTRILAEERFRETGAQVAAYLQRHYGVGLLDIEDIPGGAADIRIVLGKDLADILDRGGPDTDLDHAVQER